MMQSGQPRRNGIIIIIVVVSLIVAVGWAIFGPQGNLFQAYWRDMQLKAKLKSFELPPYSRLIDLSSGSQRGVFVMGFYKTDSNSSTVKAHYIRELAKHGFAIKNGVYPPESKSVFFCAPGYGLTLQYVESDIFGSGYSLIFGRNDTPC